MKRLCEKAGVSYKPPHALRHGHAVHALLLGQDVADLKAVSQNLMHSSLTITDSIYSVLTEKDLSERIATLGKNGGRQDPSQGFTPVQIEQLRELLSGTG
jgi:site-specific recombinase XerD